MYVNSILLLITINLFLFFHFRSRAASSLPIILILSILFWNMRKGTGMMGPGGGRRVGGLFGMGETTAKLINPSEIGVKFRLVTYASGNLSEF